MKKITFFILFLVLISVHNLNAKVHYVKTVGAGGQDASSWENASSDLQAIIDAASSGDSIFVASGTYIPTRPANNTTTIDLGNVFNSFVLRTGIKVYGGFAGTENLLSQRNWRNNKTILSGRLNANAQAYHVFIVAGQLGTDACLDGFTLTGGKGYNNSSLNITVNEQAIDHRRGGAIYITGTKSLSPVLRNLIITGNESIEMGGGALFCGWSCTNTRIENVIVNGNVNGGIRLAGGVTPTLINCLIINNTNSNNGAGLISTETSTVPFTLVNCTIADNTSGANYGGIYTAYPINMENTILWGNSGAQITFNLTGSSVNHSIAQNQIFADGIGNLDGKVKTVEFVDIYSDNYQLIEGNICVNAGSNTSYAAYGGNITSDVDVIGKPRVSDTNIDMGAFETQVISSVHNAKNSGISIYPNPAKDFVQLTSLPEKSSIEILDISGKVLSKTTVNEESARLDFNFNAGIYFIRIQNRENSYIEKIVIK